jgi:hypothetical protein
MENKTTSTVEALKGILTQMGHVEPQRTFDDLQRLIQALESDTPVATPHKDVRTTFERGLTQTVKASGNTHA